jgi:hypothetical protein
MAYEIGNANDGESLGIAHKQLLLKIQALAEANGWTTMRYDTSNPASHELILRGEGLSGTEEIYVGFRTYDNVSADYYNIAAAGFTGYVSGNIWSAQPGFRESGVPAHNQNIDYVIICNPQRIALCLKVGTPVYESCYVGKLLPYARPSQYPYPLVVAGMLNGAAATRYSETTHSMPYKGNRVNMALRWLDGSYKQPLMAPWTNRNFVASVGSSGCDLRDTGDRYPIAPVTAHEVSPALNAFGVLDGIGYVSNFNNTVESVIQEGGTPVVDNPAWTMQQRVDAIETAGGVAHVCFQDVGRTSFNDYYTMRLD